MLNSYFCWLPPGVAAHTGSDKDHGYVGMYFSVTMVLVAIETFQGAGTKAGLTVNRIIATITGVLMAIIISYLPPHVNGRDPEHTREYLDALDDAFMLLLRTFSDENGSSTITNEDFKKSLLSTAKSKSNLAHFFLNDADMWQALPFYRVNKGLRPLMDSINVTEASIQHLLDGFADIIRDDYNVNEIRTSIEAFVQDVLGAGSMVLNAPQSEGTALADIMLGWAYVIAQRLEQHRLALDTMEA